MCSVIDISAVTIAPGTVIDAAELAEFAVRSFVDTYAADNDPANLEAHLSANYGPEQQASELADPSVTTILARSNGELVAYAQVRRSVTPPCVVHGDPIELHRFYVDHRAHGSGLASELMHAVHQAAHELEGRHIWLGVWEQNPRAIAFYKKVGFVDVGSQIYRVGSDKQSDRVLVVGVQRPAPNSESRQ
jgi:ribosomal protein S18 acetylase RimI-like enzyme